MDLHAICGRPFCQFPWRPWSLSSKVKSHVPSREAQFRALRWKSGRGYDVAIFLGCCVGLLCRIVV